MDHKNSLICEGCGSGSDATVRVSGVSVFEDVDEVGVGVEALIDLHAGVGHDDTATGRQIVADGSRGLRHIIEVG